MPDATGMPGAPGTDTSYSPGQRDSIAASLTGTRHHDPFGRKAIFHP